MAVVQHQESELPHPSMAVQDSAMLRNHAGATILREAEGDLPVFPNPVVMPLVPWFQYRRVNLGGGGREMMPSHIPHSLRKNSISERRTMVPAFFICAWQHGQVVGSPPQILLIRDFQSGFSWCFFLGVGSGRMNSMFSPRPDFCLLPV